MAIHKMTAETKVDIGQFVLPESIVTHGICDCAHRVSRVSGQRIYFESEGRERHVMRKTVSYVTNTQDEADQLIKLSRERWQSINAEIKRVTLEVGARIDTKVAALVSGVGEEEHRDD